MSREDNGRDRGREGAGASDDITRVVASNLRRLRLGRGLSLERLAQASGVSRGMLGMIETAQSTPTINVLWRIASALRVQFSALTSARSTGGMHVLRAADAKRLTSADGRFVSRALFPFDAPRRVELYELRIAEGGLENAEPHPPGTEETLVVVEGAVEIEAHGRAYQLGPGDALTFVADVAHAYRNAGGAPAVMYLVMTYAEEVG